MNYIAYDALNHQGRADHGHGTPGGYDPPTRAEALAEQADQRRPGVPGYGTCCRSCPPGPPCPFNTSVADRDLYAASLATEPAPF